MKAWIWTIAVVAACGRSGGHNVVKKDKTLEELKPVWGAKVQAKLDKVIAAAKAATSAELGAPGDAQLALDFEWDEEKDHPNVFAVQIEDMQSATELRPTPPPQPSLADEAWKAAEEGKPIVIKPPEPSHPRFTFQDDGHSHVFKAKALLGVPNTGGQYPEYVYDQFVNAKYMLVVMPGEVVWPSAEGATFQTGGAKLRAILVEIDTAKPLGGFETTAQNSDKVLVNDLTGPAERIQAKLDKDFLAESGTAVVKGVEQRWPGTKTPLDWGVRTW